MDKKYTCGNKVATQQEGDDKTYEITQNGNYARYDCASRMVYIDRNYISISDLRELHYICQYLDNEFTEVQKLPKPIQ